MNKRTLPIFLALSALILASLACAFGGKLDLANFRMAHDEDGENVTTSFSPNDAVYSVADLSNAPKGTVVSSKWYAVSVEGKDPNTFIDDVEITIDEDSFNGPVYFFFSEGQDWPVGTYAVEWYLNGQLINTVTYSVQ
ncbi:MAG: hypothetical protein M5U11_09410 [Anaerolineales bacterium]|nr:hypothetical protein [Anaerolineales bacterium]